MESNKTDPAIQENPSGNTSVASASATSGDNALPKSPEASTTAEEGMATMSLTTTAAVAPPRKGYWREILKIDSKFLPAAPPAKGSVRDKAQTDPTKLVTEFSRPCLFQNKAVEFRSGLDNRGGGRGFFAIDDIDAGELILAEFPVSSIPDTPANRDPAERCVLHLASGDMPLEQAEMIMKNIEKLHPRTLNDIDQERLKGLRHDYLPFKKEMIKSKYGKKLGLCDEDTLIRVLCALHFNGFATGVYLHLAMANHSCAPNCVKWGARDGLAHSEVRAMRKIRKGEEITFSYLVPSYRPKEARQRALKGQFQFICKCELCEMSSPTCDPRLEQGPEKPMETLEQVLDDLEKHDQLYIDPASTMRICSKMRNEARMKGVHPRNLSLAHADMVTIDACLTLLDDNPASNHRTKKRVLDDQMLILTLLTRSISVRKTQLMLFKAGVPSPDSEQYVETRADAEVTLQHIINGLGFFRSLGKAGEKVLLNLKDDEDDSKILFARIREVDQCQEECDAAARAIADLYEDFPDLYELKQEASPSKSPAKSNQLGIKKE